MIPTPDELAAGAYLWDAKLSDCPGIPDLDIALLTWGEICFEFGLDDDYEMWVASIEFFWNRVKRGWDGTVEDVWLMMKACRERERLLYPLRGS